MANFTLMPTRFSMDDNAAAPQYAVRLRVVRLEAGCEPVEVPAESQAFAYRRITSVRDSVLKNARWASVQLCRDAADVTATRVRAQTRTTWHGSLVMGASCFERDGVRYRRTLEVVAL